MHRKTTLHRKISLVFDQTPCERRVRVHLALFCPVGCQKGGHLSLTNSDKATGLNKDLCQAIHAPRSSRLPNLGPVRKRDTVEQNAFDSTGCHLNVQCTADLGYSAGAERPALVWIFLVTIYGEVEESSVPFGDQVLVKSADAQTLP